jgi:hypothetical protein
MPSIVRDAMLLGIWALLVALMGVFGNVLYEAGALGADVASGLAGTAHLAALALPFFMVALSTDYVDDWRAKAGVYGFGAVFYAVQTVTFDAPALVDAATTTALLQFSAMFAFAHMLMVLSVIPPVEQRLEAALAYLGVRV